MVPENNFPEYEELETRIMEALNSGNFAEHERLSSEQMTLVAFQPSMTHSFEEEAKHVVFHAQVLADFNTIEELGRKLLAELDR